jgi:hypothetical protein
MATFGDATYGTVGLLPIPARAPLRETLGFLTDVNPTYNGGESRVRLRSKPRQRLEMDFIAQPDESKSIYNTIYGGIARRWAVPIWPLGRACGTVSETQTVVPVDTRFTDYRVGSPVLVIGACKRWFVAYVQSKAEDSVSILPPAPQQVKGAYMVPLRWGRIVSSGQKDTDGYGADWSITFEVDDNLSLEPAAPIQYDGNDIYTVPGLLEGNSLAERMYREIETFDYDVGAVAAFSPWNYSRTVRPFRAITETDAEAWAMREWVHRRAGRYRRFWQPSFENDIRLAQLGVIGSTMSVYTDDRSPYRTHIAVGMANGQWLPRKIIDETTTGANTRNILLDAPLNVNATDVRAVSYLGLRRLDADVVQFNWLGNGRCEMSVPVVELSP